MTRTYAARRLLEHGPLPFCDFLAITGWNKSVASKVLERLTKKGLVRRMNTDNVGHRRGRRHARNYMLEASC